VSAGITIGLDHLPRPHRRVNRAVVRAFQRRCPGRLHEQHPRHWTSP